MTKHRPYDPKLDKSEFHYWEMIRNTGSPDGVLLPEPEGYEDLRLKFMFPKGDPDGPPKLSQK